MSSALASVRTPPTSPLPESGRTRTLCVGHAPALTPFGARATIGLLNAMLRSLTLRDRMTARHCVSVARYARELAQATGASAAQQELVHTAGLLHDIGKFILPDSILRAGRGLTDEDWLLVKRHPAAGAAIVAQVPGYAPVARAIRHHHERIDGAGYPDGLPGDGIPWVSRVISVADAYDAMTKRGSYNRPKSFDEAVAELERVAGSQLDAPLVDAFLELLRTRRTASRRPDGAPLEAQLVLRPRLAA